VLDFVSTLKNTSIRTVGPELIFGRLFDEIGFDAIPEPMFREIVVARLAYPIGYDIFEGNTFEGKTLLPVLQQIQEKYSFGKGHRLIVAYADKRARKDQHNRESGLQRLKKRVGSGRLVKEHLNNRGYTKGGQLNRWSIITTMVSGL